jgi:diguanylate cyclase
VIDTNDVDVASGWSQRALELMTAHNVAPNPKNYDVWFRYASGRIAALNAEIDAHLQENDRFDDQTLGKLHERYVSYEALTTKTLDAGTTLQSSIEKIMKLVESNVGNTTEFRSSVRGASQMLTQGSTPTDIVSAVAAIVDATRVMEARSTELEVKLQATKKEMGELHANLAKARTEARVDGLTGVANRKAFDDELARAVAEAHEKGEPLTLIMADIDHFKKFNDKWGHRTGDQVLRLVASCLKGSAKNNDVVARYGGEEFSVIMPGRLVEDAEKVGNIMREAVQARELVKRSTNETLGRVTMSLGVAILHPGETGDTLVERADECLYAAKRTGRDRVVTELQQDALLQAKAS